MISHSINAADLHTMIDGIVARETAALRRALYLRDPPGIGAAVAMVAAARMVASGWGAALPWRWQRAHWDWMPQHISDERAPACGHISSDDYSVTGIEFVDCDACLAIHAKACGVKP